MIVRATDSDGDWLFGKGAEDYLASAKAVQQNIQTRVLMFTNDCFFALDQGLDWFNLLGAKNTVALNLAINAAILGTDGVASLVQTNLVLGADRGLTIEYVVTLSALGGSAPVAGSIGFLLTESGDLLVTEGGDRLEL